MNIIKTHIPRLLFCCALCGILLALLTVALPTSPALGEEAPSLMTAESILSQPDQETGWEDSDTCIFLEGAEARVEGEGAVVQGKQVLITSPGTYVVSGTWEDGQIVVTLTKDQQAHIVLNGADITSKTGSPLYATACDKMIVTLAEGTQNTLTDGGAAFTYADADQEEPNAALFCKDDLTINGGGALTVTAGFANGIAAKDDLRIVDATLTVEAPKHALRGNDSVLLAGARITLTAGGDGIQTNNTEDADKGWFLLEGGSLTITASGDGIQADWLLSIARGTLTITAGGGHQAAQEGEGSCKGLKSDGEMALYGGAIAIDSYDDCLHAAGNIYMAGGELTLATADDACHSDSDLLMTDGVMTVTTSYEGLEALNITIRGGSISVVASDDAINAAGGQDQSGMGGPFGGRGGGFGGDPDKYSISIEGGTLNLLSGGDGLDSNGRLTISGGEVVVLVQAARDGQSLDADGNVLVTGGTLVFGGTSAGDAPQEASTQSYVVFSGGVAAGQRATLSQNGRELHSYVATVYCAYLAFSTPEIVAGQSYELSLDGGEAASLVAGQGATGMGFGGGGGGGRQKPGGW